MRLKQLALFYISVRHTRPLQLFHRLKLLLKRQFLSRCASQAYAEKVALASDKNILTCQNLPQPLLPPRKHFVVAQNGVITVKFLNVARSLGKPIDWHPKEMRTGTRLWLLNLHYTEFLEGLDDKNWLHVTKDWIASNKPYKSGYWLDSWNSYSLSIRIVVWMQQIAVRSVAWSDDDRELILKSLVAQIRFLVNNLELDIGGNHLIKNIKALLWASRFFAGAEADQWQALGSRLLKKELGEQITDDGMHYELSPAYHAQVFADLLECYYVCDEVYRPILAEMLHGMAQNMVDTTHPDGMVSLFSDAGLHMAYQPGECLAVYEELLGKSAVANSVVIYPQAGYYGFREQADFVLFDAAALAPDFLPAHGHGDALAFEWSVNGRRVVIDPGVYEYNAGEMRDYSRSTRFHNTVTLDDLDQSEFWKAFRVGRRAKIIRCHQERSSVGLKVVASHDGYSRLAGQPIHQRSIEMREKQLRIEDNILQGDGQRAVSRIMISPDIEVDIGEGTARLYSEHIDITIESESSIVVEEAWCFLDFGCRQKTRQLVMDFGQAPCSNTITLKVNN